VDRRELIQGIWVGESEIQWLKHWVKGHPGWTRKRFAQELCRLWEWRDRANRLKDFAARSFLLKLEAQDKIHLPEIRGQMRSRRKPVALPEGWERPEDCHGALEDVRPVSLEVVQPGSLSAQRWEFYLSQYHYLGLRMVGENLGYLARDSQGREVACLLFGAAAWRCRPRDRFLKWDEKTRRQGLSRVANNTRFLILPWVRVPGLASHVLGQVARRIGQDWVLKYRHGLEWLETFVERPRFAGTCYRAANWQWVGQTTGRSRQDRNHQFEVPIKDIYLYRLGR
jgi:Domain of unknown function (DUF4338)